MKKIKILLLVISISANVFAQEINFSKKQLEYFQLINNAELAICKGSYANAISLYDSAIHMISKLNGEEIIRNLHHNPQDLLWKNPIK